MNAKCGSGSAFLCRRHGSRKNSRCARPSSFLPASTASLARPMKCWRNWSSQRRPIPGWASSPAGSASDWPWRRRWCVTRKFCFSTSLYPQSRRQLWDIIRQFQRDGGTVLLTTHYMDEAERLCDRLAIVDHGQIIAEGSPADLIDRLGGRHVVEFSVSGNHDGAALHTWKGLPSVESVREDDGLVALNGKQPHLTTPALLDAIGKQGSELRHLTTRQASLEDVFVRLTGRHLREQ